MTKYTGIAVEHGEVPILYYIKPKRKKQKVKTVIVAITAVLIIGVLAFDFVLDYMIHDTAVSLSKNTAARALNDAVIAVLEAGEYTYTDFVEINADESGAVQSVSAKSESVNRFGSEIGTAVLDALSSGKNTEFSIPLGTLTDVGIFYGRGPDINIRLRLYGDITSYIRSTFVSKGINQTNHRITCVIKANIAIITPGFTEYVAVSGEYLIAETVIIGEIPDSYTNVNDEESGIVGQIFDYADIE